MMIIKKYLDAQTNDEKDRADVELGQTKKKSSSKGIAKKRK